MTKDEIIASLMDQLKDANARITALTDRVNELLARLTALTGLVAEQTSVITSLEKEGERAAGGEAAANRRGKESP